jgi:hypothetical protein
MVIPGLLPIRFIPAGIGFFYQYPGQQFGETGAGRHLSAAAGTDSDQYGQQLSVLYSIFVRQYALTEDGYNFLSLMQSNTESLGTIFDPQPSQLKGNIQCLTNPNEPVVGYVSAGTVQQQRIFISRNQLPPGIILLPAR